MQPLSLLLESLELGPATGDRWQAANAGAGGGVIFGGQLLAQTIVVAARTQPDKEIKTVHTIFARAGRALDPVELAVEAIHAGRTFASVTVTVWQGERLCARSLVLLHTPERDFIRHGAAMPSVDGPHATSVADHGFEGWQVGVVGRADVGDPDAAGPAELLVWTRFQGAPDDLTASQALLAYATDGFLIGTAMRPHPGVGQAQAHLSISTGVVSHTITFHEPFRAGEWMLLAHQSPYAGRGRSYGQANVFTEDGRLVASFVQDGMIRHPPVG